MEKIRKNYKNKAEQEFLRLAEKEGVTFVRRGYPDFMALTTSEEIIGFVEVKPKRQERLRQGQGRFLRFCKKHNIPFWKWSPGDKFPEWAKIG